MALSDGSSGPDTPCACTVLPFLPDHDAGAPSSGTACSSPDSPQFLEAEFDAVMPGLWEVTFEVQCEGAAGSALFTFCAEG